jgi:hypothetical protein
VKKKIMVLLSITVLFMLVLTISVQPVIASGEEIQLTKTAESVVDNGTNYDITYQYTVTITKAGFPVKKITHIYVDDTIHGTLIGSKVVDWGNSEFAVGQTTPVLTWTYTTKPSDIDTDGLGNRTVTNVAYAHSHTVGGTVDIPDDDTETVPLNGGGSNLPELPAGILLGAGLIGIGGFVLIKRRSKVTAA